LFCQQRPANISDNNSNNGSEEQHRVLAEISVMTIYCSRSDCVVSQCVDLTFSYILSACILIAVFVKL